MHRIQLSLKDIFFQLKNIHFSPLLCTNSKVIMDESTFNQGTSRKKKSSSDVAFHCHMDMDGAEGGKQGSLVRTMTQWRRKKGLFHFTHYYLILKSRILASFLIMSG